MDDFQVSMISHLSHTLPFAFAAYTLVQKIHTLYTIDLPALAAPMPKWIVLKQALHRCFPHSAHEWYSSPLLQTSQMANLSPFRFYYLPSAFATVSFHNDDAIAPVNTCLMGSDIYAIQDTLYIFLFEAVNK